MRTSKSQSQGRPKLQLGTHFKSEYDRNPIKNDDLFIFVSVLGEA